MVFHCNEVGALDTVVAQENLVRLQAHVQH